MKAMGSRKLLSLWVAVFAGDLCAVDVWSGPEGFALFAKVAKFVVCRNGFLRFLVISYCSGALALTLQPLLLH